MASVLLDDLFRRSVTQVVGLGAALVNATSLVVNVSRWGAEDDIWWPDTGTSTADRPPIRPDHPVSSGCPASGPGTAPIDTDRSSPKGGRMRMVATVPLDVARPP